MRDHELQIHADTCFPASSDLTLLDSEARARAIREELEKRRGTLAETP